MPDKRPAIQIFSTIIGTLIIFFLPHFGIGPIPFLYVLPVLLIVWLLLRINKQGFANLGFKRFDFKAVFVGAVIAALLFIFLQYIFFPLLSKVIVLEKANLDEFKNIRHNFPNYIFILIMGWLVGGVYEELVFHGYIFKGIENSIKGRSAVLISFILTNLIFGLYHFQLGLSGMINAFIAGCVYNAIAIKFQRNLWYAVFTHAFFDTIALTFIYLGYW